MKHFSVNDLPDASAVTNLTNEELCDLVAHGSSVVYSFEGRWFNAWAEPTAVFWGHSEGEPGFATEREALEMGAATNLSTAEDYGAETVFDGEPLGLTEGEGLALGPILGAFLEDLLPKQ